MLDQRALPAEETWIRCESVEQVADCIRTLAVRGAPAIGIAAAYGLALADDRSLAAALLRSTRPTAVNLAWAIEQVEGADDVAAAAEALLRDQEDACRQMAAHGATLFGPGDRALTHCNTGGLACCGVGTALGVLRAAHQGGRLDHVWVGETRPLLQGARLTAYELAKAAVPHSVIADSAAGSLMARGEVERIVVGADRIAANGDVANKIGTYPLAVLAARHGIPFYVAAPVSTLDPHTPDGVAIPIEERDPAEITGASPAFNPAFDVTPAELVSAIITEAGVLDPRFAARKLDLLETARRLPQLGLVAGTEGNASVRDDAVVHITPSALPYEAMSAGDLVTLSLDGDAVGGGAGAPSSEWRVHLAIYDARSDVRAIVHTHSPAATAWSRHGRPLGEILTAAFSETGTAALADNAVEALGDRDAVLLADHGVVAVGTTLAEALATARRLEHVA